MKVISCLALASAFCACAVAFSASGGVVATGGDISMHDGRVRIHTFRSNGKFVVESGGTEQVLLIGGGGDEGAAELIMHGDGADESAGNHAPQRTRRDAYGNERFWRRHSRMVRPVTRLKWVLNVDGEAAYPH